MRSVHGLPVALVAAALALLALAALVRPPAASANVICSIAGDADGIAGKACNLLSSPKKVLSAGKKLLTGHVGGAVKSFLGGGSSSTASTALELGAIVAWVVAGAKFSLAETTKILGDTTSPRLRTTWFSATYWRMAGIAALLTLPFLFAAAVQALIQSDLALLIRAALGYLPLAMLAVAVAAPVTMLLLAATDQLCAAVSSATGNGLHPDLTHALIAGEAALDAPFLVFIVAATTTAGAIAVWLELAIREAAVYVIVLMLPLAFSAFVWPARRIWVRRAVEVLVALILSKLAIVAVLDLGGAALDQLGHHGLSGLAAGLSGTVLVLLAAFAPWATLRLVPLTELASGAVGSFHSEISHGRDEAMKRVPGGGAAPDEGSGDGADGPRGPEAERQRLADQSGQDAGRRGGSATEGASSPEGASGEAEGASGAPEGASGEASEPGTASEPPTTGAATGTEDGQQAARVLNPEFTAPNDSWRLLELSPDGDLQSRVVAQDDERPDVDEDPGAPHVEDQSPLLSEQDDGEGVL